MTDIETLRAVLLERIENNNEPREVLKAPELRGLYAEIPKLEPSERGPYGKKINELKNALEDAIVTRETMLEDAKLSRGSSCA
ncbi:hypothetical protein HY312_02920 [Candidatus Saccharibacteria bacterium]|nr:hypothetical protein [Candidatus Saccharibacteria bacterium]